jgi:amino-acid N-acetyltransferase
MSFTIAPQPSAAGSPPPPAGAAPATDPGTQPVSLRSGTRDDVPAISGLIGSNLEAGHLLPRTVDDLAAHAPRFVVAVAEGAIVGCAELAPLSRAVAEVRSLVVDEGWRGRGIGGRLIAELSTRARAEGFSTLCAFTHDPAHFVRLGFAIVPHVWFPEKIALDCTGCPKFRTCGQHAVSLSLASSVPFTASPRHLREPARTARRADAPALPPVRLRVIA